MKQSLFPTSGKFYKANLHSHSTVSDGKHTPKEMMEYYKEHGYDILALTDHELLVDHSELNQEDFLLLPGYEYAFIEDVPYPEARTIELNLYPRNSYDLKQICFNPKNVFHGEKWRCETLEYTGDIFERNYSIECIQTVIDKARRNNFLVSLNHPGYSMETPAFFGQLHGLFAMEIHNQGSFYNSCDYNPQMYQQMLRMGHKIFSIAADDNHSAYIYDDKKDVRPWGFTMIKAEALTHKAVIQALESGAFYSTQGPEIYDLYLQEGEVFLECSEVKSIIMHTRGRYFGQCHAPVGETISSAKFRIPKDEYFWFEIIDGFGCHANTRAYFRGTDFQSEQ